jgi:hypothetical protein
MVVLATQTPLIRVLPRPQPTATCVIMPSGWRSGAGVIACAEVVTTKAKPATAINLIIPFLPFFCAAFLAPLSGINALRKSAVIDLDQRTSWAFPTFAMRVCVRVGSKPEILIASMLIPHSV